MSLPKRPATLAELEASLAAKLLQEGQHLEFKRELPSNKEIARQCAALAVQGGVLVLGVEETSTGFVGSPIDYIGVREKVGQIAQDTPEPPVEPVTPETPAPPPLPPTDRRRLVWSFIQRAPSLPAGGAEVGAETAAINPWPHQFRAFEQLYTRWPPKLLIADEVGLGKTIQTRRPRPPGSR